MGFFSGVVSSLITAPISAIENIKDETLKRAMLNVANGLFYSQYITALYMTGCSLESRRFLGLLSPICKRLAASAYVMLLDQDVQKVVVLAVPVELVSDKKLLDSIHYDKEKTK